MRRRLLTQTSVGRKGVPPLTKLTKRYLQFCSKYQSGATAAELKEDYDQLLRDIAHIEFLARKQDAIFAAHRSEQTQFQEKRSALEREIEAARTEIQQRKSDLVAAREQRQHDEEYERLRGLAVKYSRCTDLESQIAQEENRLAEAKEAEIRAKRTVQLRRKQFGLLLNTIHMLSGEVEDISGAEAAPADEPAAMETET